MTPTAYPDINATLQGLQAELSHTLGPDLVGLYVHGSLASGGFNPLSSDIDILVLTHAPLTPTQFEACRVLYARLATSGAYWAARLEGPTMPIAAIRRFDPTHALFPTVQVGGAFALDGHGTEWILQRAILREHAIVLQGPPLPDHIDPISSAAMVAAVRGVLGDWWTQQLANPTGIPTREYQAYAVVTMCRALYTLATGALCSKRQAAEWALGVVGAEWHTTIERALAYPTAPQPDDLAGTLAFIRYTLEHS